MCVCVCASKRELRKVKSRALGPGVQRTYVRPHEPVRAVDVRRTPLDRHFQAHLYTSHVGFVGNHVGECATQGMT